MARVTPPGLKVPVEVPEDRVQTYLSLGWSKVQDEKPKPRGRRKAASGGDKK